jgi:glycosyltransferase involved in cell wall biosynthesis
MNPQPSTLDSRPSISVIICTYNRCESLRRTLQTCCDLIIPEGVTWELLVLDNNSTDATKQVCKEFAGKLPLRYIFESRQGKSHALNQSIDEAKGDLLLFTDDDVDVTPEWLQVLYEAAVRRPDAAFFGGKVLPRWDIKPPRWVIDNLERFPYQVHVDRGDSEAWITDLMQDNWPFLVGANFACHRQALHDQFHFPSDLGPCGGDHTVSGNVRGEETVLQQHLLKGGYKGLYVPSAIVYHRHPARRQTERYLRKYFAGWGAMEVRQLAYSPVTHPWFGAPRYLWRRLIETACRYALTRYTRPSGIWLRHEIAMAETWGMICEHRRQARLRKSAATSGQ